MFNNVRNAFMWPYWLTVIGYSALFVFGIVGFAYASVLAVQQNIQFAAIFGGISATAFLAFFIARPLRALEHNLLFITELGVIYNSYWTRLMTAVDPQTIDRDLSQITDAAIRDLEWMAGRQPLTLEQPDAHDADSRPAPSDAGDADPSPAQPDANGAHG